MRLFRIRLAHDLNAAEAALRRATARLAEERQIADVSHSGPLGLIAGAEDPGAFEVAIARRQVERARGTRASPRRVSILSADIATELRVIEPVQPPRSPSALEKRLLERDIRDA